MKQLLTERIATGLRRQSISTCSAWARNYRIMGSPCPGKWSFDHHPWTKEMHDCKEELVVGQKAAQMGFTEAALNKCFFAIDVEGKSVLYILPGDNNAGDFSSSRFDPALELSPHLRNMFSSVKNVAHKRAGSANLFVRGSRSKSKLKSDPVALCIFDEVDEMNQDNITLAFERMSGQSDKQAFMISTPTIDKKGINKFFRASSQDHFFFKCPHCNRLTELIFPECLVITASEIHDPKIRDSHIICKECGKRLEHAAKREFLKDGIWVPQYEGRLSRGFYINQLYSTMLKPWELAQMYLKAQVNLSDEQEFYNSKLGLTHTVSGAQITDAMIDDCIGGYKSHDSSVDGFITMGIDVGSYLHYEVDQYYFDGDTSTADLNLMTKCKVLKAGKVETFEELDVLMKQYRVNACVIDNQPETRKALEFAARWEGLVKLCIYGQGVAGKNLHVHSEDEYKMTVDRTNWIDVSLGRFKTKRISLPVDISQEYREHIKAQVRVYSYDKLGNPVGKYTKGENDADHLAHARNYAEIALQLGVAGMESRDISEV